MEQSLASPAALQRIGAGLIVGAMVLLGLAVVLLAEIAALVVIAAGFGAYVVEQRGEWTPGIAAGLVGSALLLVLDRQLDPLGATVVRSTLATIALGVGIVVVAMLADRYLTTDPSDASP